MDEQVLRSLIKWPNVPDCYGWLALDRRGQWRMRNEFAQENNLPGQVIEHLALKEFISRNYACDSFGRYFFQNGPQRVFVSLDSTPWVARMMPDNEKLRLKTQCHGSVDPSAALSDENGNIYIVGQVEQINDCDIERKQLTKENVLSVALLHDHDLDLFSDLAKLQQEACSFGGSWNWHGRQLPLNPIHSRELGSLFHFSAKPSSDQQN
jgi:hypothetical protein